MDKREDFMPRKRRFGPNIEGSGLADCFILRAYNRNPTFSLMVGALQNIFKRSIILTVSLVDLIKCLWGG